MTAYAKNEFYLSKKEKGFEADNRSILLHLEKTTGTTPKELKLSRQPPKRLGYVWDLFVDIYTGVPLTFTELGAWSALRQIPVEPHEIRLLMKLSSLAHE